MILYNRKAVIRIRLNTYINEFSEGKLTLLEDGRILDPATGVVENAIMVPVALSTRLDTDEERERRKNIFNWIMRREEMERYSHKNSNKFVFTLVTDNGFEKIKPESLARLIYLSSFVKWESNILMATNKTPMRKSMLPEVLNLSGKTVSRMLTELKDYIMINEDETVSLSGDYFIRGRLKYDGRYYTKIWSAVQKLYQSTSKSNHRQLGYIFRLLPYLNIEHNILCHNPLETDIEKVEPMTIKDFCEAVGFDVVHWKELWCKYCEISFMFDGKREKFCAKITTGEDETASKIVVNPNVIYSGSHKDCVKNLCKFCE